MKLFALPTRTLCLFLTLLLIACHREPDRSDGGTKQETAVLGKQPGQKTAYCLDAVLGITRNSDDDVGNLRNLWSTATGYGGCCCAAH